MLSVAFSGSSSLRAALPWLSSSEEIPLSVSLFSFPMRQARRGCPGHEIGPLSDMQEALGPRPRCACVGWQWLVFANIFTCLDIFGMTFEQGCVNHELLTNKSRRKPLAISMFNIQHMKHNNFVGLFWFKYIEIFILVQMVCSNPLWSQIYSDLDSITLQNAKTSTCGIAGF